MKILVVAEHDNSELKPATLNTVTAAQQIGDDLDLLVVGNDCAAVAEAAAKVAGVARVRVADVPELAHQVAENVTSVLMGLASEYTHILAPATTSGKNIMPRLAALSDVMQISDIEEVVSADTFVRPIYAGNALATVQSSDSLKVITVRITKFDLAAEEGGSAAIEALDGAADAGLSSFLGQDAVKSERPELTSAGIVISGGRGMQSGDNFHLLETIADKLNAAVGASRAAVDAGFVPNV